MDDNKLIELLNTDIKCTFCEFRGAKRELCKNFILKNNELQKYKENNAKMTEVVNKIAELMQSSKYKNTGYDVAINNILQILKEE